MVTQLGSQLLAQLTAIIHFVAAQFAGTWPYLLITIPLAVAVKLSGASRFITRALSAQPLVAIVLATAVGAFSPFCSCSVIPVVASLLIGGVPLAPVMAFWIASPSMDPEIFFLSVSTLGWELSLWRLGSTLVLSLAGGFITYFLLRRGWLGANILRTDTRRATPLAARVAGAWRSFSGRVGTAFTLAPRPAVAVAAVAAAPACAMAQARTVALTAVLNRRPVRRQAVVRAQACRCPQRKPRRAAVPRAARTNRPVLSPALAAACWRKRGTPP